MLELVEVLTVYSRIKRLFGVMVGVVFLYFLECYS